MRIVAKNYQDAVRGSMIGGAAGDALGYEVEFWSENEIFRSFGSSGITAYALDSQTGQALISDDTQMSMFTACGLLNWEATRQESGFKLCVAVLEAYIDWYLTQTKSYEEVSGYERFSKKGGSSWLMDVPELFSRRAPGTTCMFALRCGRYTEWGDDFVATNDSKGCGGIMRVAPLGLMYRPDKNYDGTIADLDHQGALIAALTHGHPLGYMSAAVMTHIISRIVSTEGELVLKDIVLEAVDTVVEMYSETPSEVSYEASYGKSAVDKLRDIVNLAVKLSENDDTDLNNIHRLGEGWIAEEALAISVYCSLRHQDDFLAGIIAAVNHKGDSDSTGAITGNILGAIHGYEAIKDRWSTNLELADVILELADDMSGAYQDKDAFNMKYRERIRKNE
ncbi:MAG: ADP-ribosylglycohydrolase family protein [bacterium]|nr:ADP-ribosylglycohydrolase family protein [bacterium]